MADYVVLETSGKLLLEDGSGLLLELQPLGPLQTVQVGGVYPPFAVVSITGQVITGDGHVVGGAVGNQFGALTIKLTKAVAGVSSAQAFGALTVKATSVKPLGGVASAQSFATPTVTSAFKIAPVGVSSAQSFGTPTIKSPVVKAPGAVTSAQAFGALTVKTATTRTVGAVASAQAFGTFKTLLRFQLLGVSSAQSFGALKIALRFTPLAVPSAQNFGLLTPRSGRVQPVGGVPSAQSFGIIVATVSQRLVVGAVSSAQSFGALSFALRTTIVVLGLGSEQSFGGPLARYEYLRSVVCIPLTLADALAIEQDLAAIACREPVYSITGLVITGDGHVTGGIAWNYVYAFDYELDLASSDAQEIDLIPLGG